MIRRLSDTEIGPSSIEEGVYYIRRNFSHPHIVNVFIPQV